VSSWGKALAIPENSALTETGFGLMNHRPANIETERLLLVTLLAEEIEALIAGDRERAELLIVSRFLRMIRIGVLICRGISGRCRMIETSLRGGSA